MNKVDEIAAAIYAQWEARPKYAKLQMNGILAKELAVAAIEAMRDPSPRMIAETLPLTEMSIDRETILLTEKALCFLEPDGFPSSGHAAGVESAQRLIADWRAMIDAALREA